MTVRFWKSRLKRVIAKHTLDLAESLPTFNRGFVAHLQLMRKHAREGSKRDLEQTRLPSGTKLALPRLLLTDLYPAEELQKLLSSVTEAFGKPNFLLDFDPAGELSAAQERLWGSSRLVVGIFTRDKRLRIFTGRIRVVENLPRTIARIHVEIYRLYPSLYMLSFTVELSESVSNEINCLHEKAYLEPTEFKAWLPLGKGAYTSSHGPEDEVRRIEIENYISSVKASAEEVIREFFPRPKSWGRRGLACLKDLQIVAFKEAPPCDTHKVGFWGRSLGVSHHEFSGFHSSEAAFAFSGREDHTKPEWTLLTYRLQEAEEDDFSKAEMLNAFGPTLSLVALLEGASEEVGRLRLRLYNRVLRKRFMLRFRADLSTQSRLLIERFLVDRLSVERREDSNSLRHWSGELSDFKSVRENTDLFQASEAYIEGLERNISTHLNLACSLADSYVQARNTEVTFRMSRQIAIWTAIVTLATILSTLAGLDKALGELDYLRTKVRTHLVIRRETK